MLLIDANPAVFVRDYTSCKLSLSHSQINGKPTFLLNDFRKKVDAGVKGARYVSAFRKALQQQSAEKVKQVYSIAQPSKLQQARWIYQLVFSEYVFKLMKRQMFAL